MDDDDWIFVESLGCLDGFGVYVYECVCVCVCCIISIASYHVNTSL